MTGTLLIADDSDGKIMLMEGMMKRLKWEGTTLIARNTDEAKKLIDENTVDFAFIDFYIPSENGPAVIAYLKEKNPAAHIALVSSSDKYENKLEAEAAGAEAVICTSYEADEVERQFTDVIAEWQA